VAAGGGSEGLQRAFETVWFTVSNRESHRARIRIETRLPDLLTARGWSLEVTSTGGQAFDLAPGETRRLTLRAAPGREITIDELTHADDVNVHVIVHRDEIALGGMTFQLDAGSEREPHRGDPTAEAREASALLTRLGVPTPGVKAARIRRVTVDIDLDDQ
jgi:hypothetical protein